MRPPRELVTHDLDEQAALMVPNREVMSLVSLSFGSINIAPVTGVNFAVALNAATIGSSAGAIAGQFLSVGQL